MIARGIILQTTNEVNFRMNGMTVEVDYDESNITDDVDCKFCPKNVDWRARGYVTHVKYQVKVCKTHLNYYFQNWTISNGTKCHCHVKMRTINN